MPDVAVIVGYPVSPSTFTVSPTGGDTVTKASARQRLTGPPSSGEANKVGNFILQVPSTDTGHTANTYRWTDDEFYYTTSPTGYVYAGNAFVSLGGL
jgi:hypothetical protein